MNAGNQCDGGDVEAAVVGEEEGGKLLLTPGKKRCDDEEELQLLKQIESLFLLKELPSSPECWPCGAEKQPSALQR